jgi:hypothetical protein
VQLCIAIQAELLEIGGLDGEEGALAVGFGKLKAAGGLLDVVPDLSGNLFPNIRRATTGMWRFLVRMAAANPR